MREDADGAAEAAEDRNALAAKQLQQTENKFRETVYIGLRTTYICPVTNKQTMKNTVIRRSTKSVLGTRFHGHTVTATRAQLKATLGNPQYVNLDFEEKVQHEWVMEIDGHVFTVYDWKEGRWNKLSDPVEWHIGAESVIVADYAHRELCGLLKK